MDKQRAVRQLEWLIEDAESHLQEDDFDEIYRYDIAALNIAIAAVKRDIELKPETDCIDGDYICPKCKSYLSSELRNLHTYCCCCGQSITLEGIRKIND